MASWNVVEAELIEWLRTYEGPRFHAVLSDPPYALISIAKRFGPGQSPAQEGSDGRYERVSRGFMGSTWDGFESLEEYQKWITEWSKLLIEKALYPGAVCMFFGGTRTFHHLGVGLENGGFEIVDCLMWVYGSGFPKSHDVSKGLDKSAGMRRTEVLGTKPGHEGNVGRKTAPFNQEGAMGGFHRPWMEDQEALDRYHSKLAPVTNEAKTWDGYGTALKPAFEPIFLCRAPRGDKTFAQLAVEFGTGALNIDQSRVGYASEGDKAGATPQGRPTAKSGALAGGTQHSGERGEFERPEQKGRWPANFVLSHHEDCISIGEMLQPAKEIRENTEGTEGSFGLGSRRKPKSHYRIKGRTINRFTQNMMPFGGAEGEEYESEQMPPEVVERYACVPECPVRMLDDQAGEAGGGFATRGASTRIYGGGKGFTEATGEEVGFGDAGGPSRFFYTAKASRSEKDKGLEEFYWKRGDDGFERISLEEYEQLDKRERARGCIHPTVKPLELLRYLSTLSLPPRQEGRIRRMLIPFSGSGSEMIGAAQAGWDEITGIEMEENYVMMAEARISATVGMF